MLLVLSSLESCIPVIMQVDHFTIIKIIIILC